ncbi:MAG: cytochrome c biogenesis protein CcsA [Dehalococcoidia bacterium]|nr:cytochrome c biogenesis protein CcsA [Dehalococcoidia bacterium]
MSFLGNALLILTMVTALFGIAAFLLSARPGRESLARQGRQATFLVASFMTLAVAVLLLALLSHDFSMRYVYLESTRSTPLIYLISALWAGNPGSLLFWGWLVAIVGAVLLWRGKVSKNVAAYTLTIVLFTEIFFLIIIFLQNPFDSLYPIPTDGQGMNPLLQNPGMIFHPPALLIGWALALAPFAMTIGALITRRLDSQWLISARRWALASWTFLGIGNLLGAWWAYYELGWGGYWAWDAVENAGLMPWLLVTAFLHATMMWRRRGLNKIWSMAFIIFAFFLTIFGAYLTRSDILSSVHTFGGTPAEPVFVAFMAIVLFGALALVIKRWQDLKDEPGDNAIISGETTFFVNNLLFALATIAIFIGTMYPFFSHFTGPQVEQEAHFFNGTAVPVFLAAILLSGLCVLVGFKKPRLAHFGRALIWPTAGALVVTLVIFIFFGTGPTGKWHVMVSWFILAFALFATITKWARDITQYRVGKKGGLFRACHHLFSANRARYGGYIVHIAIVIIAVGITGSSAYSVHLDDLVLSAGQPVQAQAYTLTYNGYTTSSTDTPTIVTADFELRRGDKLLGTISPSLNYYATSDLLTYEASVRSTLADDVYISLWHIDMSQDVVGVSIKIYPMVAWIWIGSIVLFIGGLWAFSAPAKKATGNEDD